MNPDSLTRLLAEVSDSHGTLKTLIETNARDIYWVFSLLVILILGSYAFSAIGFAYTFWSKSQIYTRIDELLTNHIKHLREELNAVREGCEAKHE